MMGAKKFEDKPGYTEYVYSGRGRKHRISILRDIITTTPQDWDVNNNHFCCSQGGGDVGYISPKLYVSIFQSILTAQIEDGDKQHTLFTLASKYGRTNIVRDLLEISKDLIHQKADNISALAYAVVWGHTETVSLLLSKAMSPFDSSAIDSIFFYERYCYENCEHERRKRLLRVLKIFLNSIFKLFPQTPPSEMITFESKGLTIAMATAAKGEMSMMQYLAEKKVDFNKKDSHGYDVVKYAAMFNTPEILSYILSQLKNYDINTASEDGDTALMLAVYYANQVTAEVLLENGANLFCVNKAKETAFEKAIKINNMPLALWAWEKQLAELLKVGFSNSSYQEAEASICKGFTFLKYEEGTKKALIRLVHAELTQLCTSSACAPTTVAMLSDSSTAIDKYDNIKYLIRNAVAHELIGDDLYDGLAESLIANSSLIEPESIGLIFTELKKIDTSPRSQLFEARFYFAKNDIKNALNLSISLVDKFLKAKKFIAEIFLEHPQEIIKLSDTPFRADCLTAFLSDLMTSDVLKQKLNAFLNKIVGLKHCQVIDDTLLTLRKKLFSLVITESCHEPSMPLVEKVWGQQTLLTKLNEVKSQEALQQLYSTCLTLYETTQSFALITSDTKKKRDTFREALQKFSVELNPPVTIVIDETFVSQVERLTQNSPERKTLVDATNTSVDRGDMNGFAWYTKALLLEKKLLHPSTQNMDDEIIYALDKALEYSRHDYLPALMKRASLIRLEISLITFDDIVLHCRLHLEILLHPQGTSDQKRSARSGIQNLSQFIDQTALGKFGDHKESLEKIKMLGTKVDDLENKQSRTELELPEELKREIQGRSSENLKNLLGLQAPTAIYAPILLPSHLPPTAPTPFPPPVAPGAEACQKNFVAAQGQIDSALIAQLMEMVATQTAPLLERITALEAKTQALETENQTLRVHNETLRTLVTQVSGLFSTASSQLSAAPVTPQSSSAHTLFAAPQHTATNSPVSPQQAAAGSPNPITKPR